MSSIRCRSIAFLAAGCFVVCACLTVQGQDQSLDLVDQHGRKVELRELGISSKPVPEQQQGAMPANKSKADVRISDGKIIIVEHDGKKREIDVSGAQNIVVSKSVQSIIENGQEQNRITGKAIIIGPDGERQEFDLNSGSEGLNGNIQGVFEMLPLRQQFQNELPARFGFGNSTNADKFMIGVNCSPVSAQLRSHLDLEDGVGLVVESVPREGTPAAKAGVARNDILISANAKPLTTTNDLIEMVQAAGSDNQSIALTLIRRGNEMKIEIKPAERQVVQWKWSFDPGRNVFVPGQVGQDFQLERVGPGLLFDADQKVPAGILERMDSLEQRIQQRMQEFSQMQQEILRSIPKAEDKATSNDDG